jgi:RIO kinase 1
MLRDSHATGTSNSNGFHETEKDWDEVEYYDALAASLGFEEESDAWTDLPRNGVMREMRKKPLNKKSVGEMLAISDGGSLEEKFITTYKPARYEEVFLADSLKPLVEKGLIRDVLALVKGGKEANVYLCEAEPATGRTLVAAKVYRPRQFRNLRNDTMYREGRDLLNAQGNVIKAQTSNRVIRAVNKKSSFGAEVLHGSWVQYEFDTLDKLYRMGGQVPQPYATGSNVLLMEYIGDRHQAAPPLYSVTLDPLEAKRLLREIIANIELMIGNNLIHGDLSAYNILYWEGKATIIDFPQVSLANKNNNAWFILRRDIQRVCDYFASQGAPTDADAIAQRLWTTYVKAPQSVFSGIAEL